jgi:hypothetical protein
VEEGGYGAVFLRGFKDIVRDMKRVFVIDGEDAEMEMGDVEIGGGNENFGRGGVFKASEAGFM